jgi:hypothetical protein
MRGLKNACSILVKKLKMRSPLGRPSCKQEENVVVDVTGKT